MSNLTEKYNVAAPRYTSYPTVPYWDTTPTQEQWVQLVSGAFVMSNDTAGISLYIHLPFCESLCTYCGCNTRITVNHKVEVPYITAVLKEWEMYTSLTQSPPRIKEIHLGGGTPTFFGSQNLHHLLQGILSTSLLCSEAELSFEAHPNNTTREHLETLYYLGFRRISLGIQDFDINVQHIINRVQSYAAVKEVTEQARSIGYTSVNYDLIYGLPLQTEKSMQETIAKVITLHPDRIAFYSYAHVPWIKPGQRKFTEADLPAGETKRRLYEQGRNLLEAGGYIEIGMDHFALQKDQLHTADKNKTLHRNFMGYTTSPTLLLIGLGVSSISDSWTGFVQNEKKVEDYYKRIAQGVFPFFKGHILTQEDLLLRKHILNIMCKQETHWEETKSTAIYESIERLKQLLSDGFIQLTARGLKVKPEGKPYLRNICMAMDARLWSKQPSTHLFSKTV
jgi:oxygen-independent coproporphyrinogen III oxidase